MKNTVLNQWINGEETQIKNTPGINLDSKIGENKLNKCQDLKMFQEGIIR